MNFHEDFVDDILKEAVFEKNRHKYTMRRVYMVRLHLKKKMSLTAAVLPKQLRTCVMHSITLSLTRTTTVMPNGNMEEERRTNVCFSENVTPGDVDMEALISDILSEILLHFKTQRHRQCHGNYSV
uniref:Uncharacterized protein n=1 Tax=Magallana gigas TaxID=29159 RepID=K1R5J2_MAGGI